jgi:hypothetical protein
MQTILVYIAFVIAAGYLLYSFWPKKNKSKNCGNDSCGCH